MEINPESEPLQKLNGQWQKIVMVMMCKLRTNHVLINDEDMETLSAKLEGTAMVVQEDDDGLHLTLMDYDEAMDLAKENGDLDE